MKLVVIAALIAVTSSAKLDRTYLPPASAETAGGSHDSLQTPLIRSSNQGSEAPQTTNPLGSYTNNFQGVVVDAAAPGTRASADQLTGLGGPRPSYGSTDSKVGDAAFRGSAGFRDNRPSSFGNTDANGPSSFGNIGFAPENKPERAQAFSDRNSNILAYSNDVGTDNYSYGFETDNGIAVGENGVAVNGIQAEGGYSYTGDDGQVYKVTYVADDKGYRPVGAHLPTPPPIPQEILKSLEKNAQDEAAGLVDDGSYDAQKYNAEGDYTQHNGGNNPHNGAQLSQFGSRPESDAITSGTFINQNSQAFAKPGLSGQVNGNQFGSQVNGNQFGSRQQSSSFKSSQGNDASSNGFGNSQFGQQTSQSKQFGISQSQQQNGFATSQSGNHHSQSNNGQGNHDQNYHLSQNSGNHFETSGQTTHSQGGALNGQHNSQFGQQTGQFGAKSAQQNFGQGSLSNNVQNSLFGQQSGSQYNAAKFNTQAQNVEGQTAQESNTQSGSAGQFNQFQANSQAVTKPVAGQQNTQFGANFNGGSQINVQAQAFNGQRTSTSFSQQKNANFQSQTSQTQSNNNVNKFSTNAFNQQSKFGQQPNAFGSNTVNGLSQSNRFETINQYLPPKGNEDSGMQEISSTITSNQDQNDQIPDFVPLENRPQRVQQSFVSASASASSQPAQTRRPVNRFPTTSNNFNNQATQGQVQFNSQSNSQRNSISSNGNGFNGASKPTVVPQTELTTPLEPNEESSQGSKFTQTTASVSNFGLQSTNNFGQPQQNSQSSNDQSASQTLSSSFPTQPQFASTSNSNNVEQQVSNGRPQFSQNTFGSQQNMKPSFTQRPDDSYHYNQPSKPFNTPFNRPQGSRFPSSTSQSNNFGTQNSQFNNQQNLGTTTKQSNPTLGSVSPTAPTQLSQSQGFQTNQFNGITQAAISPFPAVSPTTSSQFGAASNQFGSKPGFTQQSASFSQSQNNAGSFTQQTPFPSRPVSNFNQQSSVTQNQAQVTSTAPENVSTQESQSNQNEPMTQNQQYEGTIYEYNKPPESLPAPSQSDSDSSQTVQSAIASSQGNQITSSPESSKPQTFTGSSMIGQPSRGQSTSFGSSSASFNSQTPQDFNKPKPFGGISSSSQFSQSSQISQSSTSQGPKQNIQSNGAFRPFSSNFGSSSQGYPSAADSKPQFGLQLPQNKFSQNSQQTFGSQTSSQPATGFSFNNNQNQQTFTQTNTNFPQSTKPNLVQNNFDQSPQTTVSQSQYTGTTQIQSQSDVNANNPFKPTGQVSATASVTTNANDGTVAANTNFQAVSNQSNNPVQNGQTKPLFNSACCQNTNGSAKPKQPSQFGSQFVGSQGNVQSAGGNGEDFSGPKQPPSFDENGYHY